MNVLITGASRGLGYSMAMSLVKSGNTLFVHYNKGGMEAKSCVKAIESTGAKAFLISSNLSQKSGVDTIISFM